MNQAQKLQKVSAVGEGRDLPSMRKDASTNADGDSAG